MIRPFAVYSFLFLLIVGLFLPSDGNHGTFAPKSLAFLSSTFFFLLYFLTKKEMKSSQSWAALIILTALFFLGVFYVVGIDQNPQIKSGQLDQFKVFVTTLFPPFAAWFLVKDNLISFERIMRTLIYTNFLYNFIKTSLMALHVLGVIHVWTVMHKTGLRYMSMHIIGDIGRIQTSVDIVTPFLLYFVLQSKALGIKLSNRFKCLYVFFGVLSVFLSFSRFLIFAFLISIFFHVCTLRWSRQIKLWALGLGFCCLGIGAAGPEKVLEVVEKRFFSADNAASDATRNDQIDALMTACDQNPLLGKGLGGYTTACIRDFDLPHAYEVQWVAFLMQFGLLGLLILFIPIAIIALNFTAFPWTRAKLGYFLLFGLWIFSGFTNPFLISLTSGIIYMIFLLAGNRLKSA